MFIQFKSHNRSTAEVILTWSIIYNIGLSSITNHCLNRLRDLINYKIWAFSVYVLTGLIIFMLTTNTPVEPRDSLNLVAALQEKKKCLVVYESYVNLNFTTYMILTSYVYLKTVVKSLMYDIHFPFICTTVCVDQFTPKQDRIKMTLNDT